MLGIRSTPVVLSFLAALSLGAAALSSAGTERVLPLSWPLVQAHEQLFPSSCIPSGVELLLKLLGEVEHGFDELQAEWSDRTDGSFADFDGRSIHGVELRRQFWLPRDENFPLADLYATIDAELDAGRYVVVSLPNGGGGWHIYVIFGRAPHGDFLAVSRMYGSRDILMAADVKARIEEARGTDVLTYRRVRRP